MPINTYADVKQFISATLTAMGASALHAPHHEFWNTLSYTQFTTGNVPGVSDANSGQPLRICIPGDPNNSNIIEALSGTGTFSGAANDNDRMPYGGPPWFTQAQIDELADWIHRGCPE